MRGSTWRALVVGGCSLGLLAAVPGCGGSSKDDDGSGGGGGGTVKENDGGKKDAGTHTVTLTDGAVITVENDGGGVVVVEEDGAVVAVDAGCMSNADCAVGVCMPDGTCDPTATDGQQDSTETDTDCGGALNADGTMNTSSDNAPPCKDTKKCLVGYDCVDKVCASAPEVGGNGDGTPVNCPSGASCTCQPPTVTDGVQNDSETDEDCGGQKGANGVANPASDQAGGTPSLCSAGAAETGQHCKFGSDCNQGVCNANAGAGGLPDDCPAATICTCQLGSPNDQVQNAGESDVDCGGNTTDNASPCPNINPITSRASTCVQSNDCVSLNCSTTTNTCVPATSTDHIQNGGETDVDCGGAVDANGVAIAGSDGAPKCPDVNTATTTAHVSACSINNDCKSAYCSTVQKICVDGQSCAIPVATETIGGNVVKIAAPILDITTASTATTDAIGTPNRNGMGEIAGITTCGRGEATDDHSAMAGLVTHDSCCKSLDVSVVEAGATAATTVRVDKYEVTAGRMRQFVEATSQAEGGTYNLRAWVKAQFNAALTAPITPAGVLIAAQLPIAVYLPLFPDALSGDDLNMLQQLGGTTMDGGTPSSFQGCYSTTGAAGAGTYWFDAAEQATVASSVPRPFTQDYYDIKSMNCTPYWMAAAFCAWDGGRLTAREEYEQVWGTGTYPWGNTSRQYESIKSTIPQGALNQDYTINNLNEPEDFYFYPSGGNPATSLIPDTIDVVYTNPPTDTMITLDSALDYTPYIAAPGRFKGDVSAKTATGVYSGDVWYDLAANMFEYPLVPASRFTGAGGTFCDTTEDVLYATNNSCPTSTETPKPATCTTTNYNNQKICGFVRSTQMTYTYWLGGSWEIHGIPGGVDNNAYGEYLETQYGKAGFRCARAAEPQ